MLKDDMIKKNDLITFTKHAIDVIVTKKKKINILILNQMEKRGCFKLKRKLLWEKN